MIVFRRKNQPKKCSQGTYELHLNDSFYGRGSLEFMSELFKDYVVNHAMYGKTMCDVKVIKIR
jgi:hypothetical protein